MKKQKYVMPPRATTDGPVSVTIAPEGIRITCADKLGFHSLTLGAFNAWRVLGMLSIVLQLPLKKAAGKAICF